MKDKWKIKILKRYYVFLSLEFFIKNQVDYTCIKFFHNNIDKVCLHILGKSLKVYCLKYTRNRRWMLKTSRKAWLNSYGAQLILMEKTSYDAVLWPINVVVTRTICNSSRWPNNKCCVAKPQHIVIKKKFKHYMLRFLGTTTYNVFWLFCLITICCGFPKTA